jgi:hypothetical protein
MERDKMDEKEKFETWGILELMGHRRLVGKLSEETIAGAAYLRIDILNPDGQSTEFKATQYYTSGAIYCITPMTFEAAFSIKDENAYYGPHILSLPEKTED